MKSLEKISNAGFKSIKLITSKSSLRLLALTGLLGERPLRLLDILHRILCPLVDGVLALGALRGEVGEAFLEGQAENFHIDVVG